MNGKSPATTGLFLCLKLFKNIFYIFFYAPISLITCSALRLRLRAGITSLMGATQSPGIHGVNTKIQVVTYNEVDFLFYFGDQLFKFFVCRSGCIEILNFLKVS